MKNKFTDCFDLLDSLEAPAPYDHSLQKQMLILKLGEVKLLRQTVARSSHG